MNKIVATPMNPMTPLMDDLRIALLRVAASAKPLCKLLRECEVHFHCKGESSHRDRTRAANNIRKLWRSFHRDLRDLVRDLNATGCAMPAEYWLSGLSIAVSHMRYMSMMYTQLMGALDILLWTSETLAGRIHKAFEIGMPEDQFKLDSRKEFVTLNCQIQCIGFLFNQVIESQPYAYLTIPPMTERVQEYRYANGILVGVFQEDGDLDEESESDFSDEESESEL